MIESILYHVMFLIGLSIIHIGQDVHIGGSDDCVVASNFKAARRCLRSNSREVQNFAAEEEGEDFPYK
jgi:hypothetical protein